MKLSTRQDIEAPLAEVYAAFADVEAWERAALRRGVEVMRQDNLYSLAVGMTWHAGFKYRGKNRKVEIRLSRLEAPQLLGFAVVSANIEADVVLDFVALSAKRTRITIGTEVRPRGLAARVFLQSLKLAKGKVDRKYAQRIGILCADIEQRLRGVKPIGR